MSLVYTNGMARVLDVAVIGGGFFGVSLANYFRTNLGIKNVVVLEKEKNIMQRASLINQARVHNGYHYPRSLLTAFRSRVNFPRFTKEFEPAIKNDFDKYYAIANHFSKVTARQFDQFCKRIGADIDKAPQSVTEMFDKRLISAVYKVKEFAFDAQTMRNLLLDKSVTLGVDIVTNTPVHSVSRSSTSGILEVSCANGKVYLAKKVVNCAYSLINTINSASGLPVIPLKHELTEMALMSLPEELKGMSVTVMCGPFFSFMPFPSRGDLHTLSHVRYTPHDAWMDRSDEPKIINGHKYLMNNKPKSNYKKMIADAARYLPIMNKCEQKDSIWEVKTVLPQSEGDDSRPILFKPHHGLPNYTCILGGKIDNIYDAYRELELIYGAA